MPNPYSAGPQALGYLYQVRYGLFSLLRENKPDLSVSIESLDDIEVGSRQSVETLAQLKHHITRQANLTDTSPDIWKTLRIWSEGYRNGTLDPDSLQLHLVTTATAPQGSAASYLQPGADRKPRTAVQILLDAAAASKSKDKALQNAFSSFRKLSDPQQILLMESVYVFDNSHDISDLEEELKKLIRFAAPPEIPVLDRVYQELEGWWFGVAVRHLLMGSKHPISAQLVSHKLWNITEELQSDNLPIRFSDSEPAYSIDPANDPRTFVHQLRVLNTGTDRIRRAILDYYRAFEQRSSWLKERLLIDDELEIYERRLIDAWFSLKLVLEEELLSDDAQESMYVDVGKQILRWMETKARIPIRTDVVEDFVMRGSFHMLANEGKPRVYWHPKFLDRLKEILIS